MAEVEAGHAPARRWATARGRAPHHCGSDGPTTFVSSLFEDAEMPSDSPSTQNGYLVSVFRWRVILVPKTLCMAHFCVWVTPLETV